MYCRKCGTQIAEGMSFCTNCGERVAPLAVTIEEQAAADASEAPQEQSAAEVQPAEKETATQNQQTASEQNVPAVQIQSGIEGNTILPPIIPAGNTEKTKTDFGKGALAFCLVVIGLLAVSTGVFAGLYFSLI